LNRGQCPRFSEASGIGNFGARWRLGDRRTRSLIIVTRTEEAD